MAPKPQRIRDPLHNIVSFGAGEFEHTLWQVIQTRPFQRLRRIKQLGFSELVFPGATHTRFAHSVGVFHTARRLMGIITRHLDASEEQVQVQVSLAAALVHDIGHGMFSHSFEAIGKELGLKMAQHEAVTEEIIRSDEMAEAFNPLGESFAEEVAKVIGRSGPRTLYNAVVTSQFDADRLDYMQRDRLMAGVQHTAIDFAWLIDNLEVGVVPEVVDDEKGGDIETFVLGSKAIHAAETFIVALFQLYPTIYYHKATRGAEKVFSALMLRLIPLVWDGHADKTGLPDNHPIIRFAKEPESLENVLALDDMVLWGALPMLVEAHDPTVARLAKRLRDRELRECIDIRSQLMDGVAPAGRMSVEQRKELKLQLDRMTSTIKESLQGWSDQNSETEPRILIDTGERDPYKPYQESKGPLNQMRIRIPSGKILDISDYSPVVAGLEKFEFLGHMLTR